MPRNLRLTPRGAFDFGDQTPLPGNIGCRREYGVVSADIADNLGPSRAVQRQRDALCGANSGLYHEQVGTRRLQIPKQAGHLCNLIVGRLAFRWKFVATRGFDGADFPEVTANAGLRRREALRRQAVQQRLLRPGGTTTQYLPYSLTAIALYIG
jgi:hypothetical protein